MPTPGIPHTTASLLPPSSSAVSSLNALARPLNPGTTAGNCRGTTAGGVRAGSVCTRRHAVIHGPASVTWNAFSSPWSTSNAGAVLRCGLSASARVLRARPDSFSICRSEGLPAHTFSARSSAISSASVRASSGLGRDMTEA
ncbi:hypothetical protein AB0E59_22025 [Lentzea sp. NPDC034063]|uniref:hypothetical protein n=1 Tax=unclassified Lentzea TaxID=2643253 RepID=UPI0033F6343C